MNSIRGICKDESLCGHALVVLPQKLMNFSRGKFSLYPDPDHRIVLEDHFFYKKVCYIPSETDIRNGHGIWSFRSELLGEPLLLNAIECIGRRILGPLAAAGSCLLVPIGFIAKAVHFSLHRASLQIASMPVTNTICSIWSDSSLWGHALTSFPQKCYRAFTAPLSWHLRPDGTDRRGYYAKIDLKTGARIVEQQPEWELMPFELFEATYRVGIGVIGLAAVIISPLGLSAKIATIAARTVNTRSTG